MMAGPLLPSADPSPSGRLIPFADVFKAAIRQFAALQRKAPPAQPRPSLANDVPGT